MFQAQSSAPLLALGSDDNSVSLLDRHGKAVCQPAIRCAETRATLACLAWHPRNQVLSAAWSSGAVRIAHVSHSGAPNEKALSGTIQALPVLLAWSPTGSSLILGYETGGLRIWKQPSHTEDDPLAWAQVLLFNFSCMSTEVPQAHGAGSTSR